MNKIKKSETEWKKLLDEKTYNITRKSGTEQPFTGKYINEKSKGIYGNATAKEVKELKEKK